MCGGNASGNDKLKIVVIQKAMITQGYQTKLHSCPLLQPERSTDESGGF
jgi:hypothetical protein